jgi:hypothetical protein
MFAYTLGDVYEEMHTVSGRTRGEQVPFQLEFDPEVRILVLTATGKGSADDGYAALRAMSVHPALGPRTPVLIDIRNLDYLPTRDEARTFGREFAAILADRRVAVLTEPGVRYGVARAVEQLAALYGGDLAAFMSADEALRWLRPRQLRRTSNG